ncbi:3-oxoacyl-ACP reductase FabG [Candidatus Enterovibrio escicola]|uniref:3-oxoacyl-[acyl-carrier-protein] reductase n=1 Tax=Candidatus Enterovibrio escicola TaxID=1927127 RepID=A0A2A5T2D1_9GAMM|nr:3-oxoacyl-ACP reductase FabG [Candidatus Enterovibrio escacola]PCS22327.1 3-oxoacyl-[acyl-carrier protein] reductase [Candidatus Enterovibrio escacola]
MTMKGKIALVTGANRGIGCEIAKILVERGATVVGTATSESGASVITGFLGESGKGYALDVTSTEAIKTVLIDIKEDFGDIDVLVNNAGITRDNLVIRMKEDEWQDIMDTNLTSVFHMSKAVVRAMMKKRCGRIINVGSVVAAMGNAGQVNYAASKAGVVGFTKSMAREVASRGITVNTVSPGFIETDMTKSLNAFQLAETLAKIPVGRLGVPRDIAATVAFLASDDAAYITGETLHVNGGMYMI